MDEMNKNIEGRIKKIVQHIKEDYDKKLDATIKHEKEELLKKLFDMFPYSDKDKEHIVSEFMKNTAEENNKNPSETSNKNIQIDEIVIEQFSYNGNTYYYDKKGCIWDDNANIVGLINEFNLDRIPKNVYLYNKKYNLDNDIYKYIDQSVEESDAKEVSQTDNETESKIKKEVDDLLDIIGLCK